jgi:hypothetical protein
MFDWSYAPSTVNTYLSALGYSHKLMGLMDSTKIFYIVEVERLWQTGISFRR